MSDPVLSSHSISVSVPSGWEVEFSELDSPPGERRRPMVQFANFALPAERGDYGSGAVETMDSGGIFMVLMEFDNASTRTAMFSGTAVPTDLDSVDFSPQVLQRRLPGQSGAQRFFRTHDRAFGLYIVLGSGRASGLLVPEVNRMLRRVTVAPLG